ncbi:MAG: T9SS type A sorting domain-containing protein [Bacteroidales bacterium]|nr:T9SS type A sorting domain-containing protein [Bacteroidales bacterium]
MKSKLFFVSLFVVLLAFSASAQQDDYSVTVQCLGPATSGYVEREVNGSAPYDVCGTTETVTRGEVVTYNISTRSRGEFLKQVMLNGEMVWDADNDLNLRGGWIYGVNAWGLRNGGVSIRFRVLEYDTIRVYFDTVQPDTAHHEYVGINVSCQNEGLSSGAVYVGDPTGRYSSDGNLCGTMDSIEKYKQYYLVVHAFGGSTVEYVLFQSCIDSVATTILAAATDVDVPDVAYDSLMPIERDTVVVLPFAACSDMEVKAVFSDRAMQGRSSITDVHGGVRLSVAPNPASDRVVLSLSNVSILPSYALYDSRGRCVMQAMLSSMQTAIDVSSLMRGVYILRVYDKESSYAMPLIVR